MWGVEVWFHSSLTVVLDGAEWSMSCPSCLASGEETYWYPFNRMLGVTQSWSGYWGAEMNLVHAEN
jgi:hypothetical protein